MIFSKEAIESATSFKTPETEGAAPSGRAV
jgi:hypothetical protein